MTPCRLVLAPVWILVIALLLAACAPDSTPAQPEVTASVPANATASIAALTPAGTPLAASTTPLAATATVTGATAPPVQATPARPTIAPAADGMPAVFPYGVVYAVDKSDWTTDDRLSIREQLAHLQDLGANTIVQTFSSRLRGTGREQDWLILLDEADRLGIGVIARLWPLEDWDGEAFDLTPVQDFLAVVGDHPALTAYLGLHEPLERFDGDQLRAYYAGVKRFAPTVPIAHYMGHMAWFEHSARYPNRDFSAGICDICIVWYTPAGYQDGEPFFDAEQFRQVLRENRALVDERAPGVHVWTLGQTYAQQAHRSQLRMPAPEEMEAMYTIAVEEGVDGFLWYPWLHGSVYDQVLSDAEMEPQRQAVRRIYESYVRGNVAP